MKPKIYWFYAAFVVFISLLTWLAGVSMGVTGQVLAGTILRQVFLVAGSLVSCRLLAWMVPVRGHRARILRSLVGVCLMALIPGFMVWAIFTGLSLRVG